MIMNNRGLLAVLSPTYVDELNDYFKEIVFKGLFAFIQDFRLGKLVLYSYDHSKTTYMSNPCKL